MRRSRNDAARVDWRSAGRDHRGILVAAGSASWRAIGGAKQVLQQVRKPLAKRLCRNDVAALVDEDGARDSRHAIFSGQGEVPARSARIAAKNGGKVKAGLVDVLLGKSAIFVEVHADDFEAFVVIGAIIFHNVGGLGPALGAEAGKEVDKDDFTVVGRPIELGASEERAFELERFADQVHSPQSAFVDSGFLV